MYRNANSAKKLGSRGTRWRQVKRRYSVLDHRVRDRTALTVVLVWGSQPNNGWGERLLARLDQTEAKLRATGAA